MSRVFAITCASLIFGLWAIGPGIRPAYAQHKSTIAVNHAWARATPPNAPTGVVYLTIQNVAATADRLVSASSSRADHVEIHKTTKDGDIVHMSAVPEGLAVPADGTVIMAPGGYHLMLVRLKGPLKAGEKLPLELTFAHAGTVHVDAVIKGMGKADGAMTPGMNMPMKDMKSGHM